MARPRKRLDIDLAPIDTGLSEAKKPFEFVAMCKEKSPEALNRLYEIMIDPFGKATESLKAAEIILAYAYGRPAQRTEITGANGGALQIDANITVAELDKQIAELEQLLTAGHNE